MEIESQAQFDKHYKRLLNLGFEEKVANYVAGLQKEGMITDDEWDSKALEALKTLPANSAISLLENLKSSNYRNAINKSAYLFSAIKAQRQRLNGERTNTPTLLSNGPSRNRAMSNSEYKNQRSNSDSYSHNFYTGMAIKRFNGAHSVNSRSNGFYPEKGCEIICRNVPKIINEDELLAIMEKIGPVWEIRIINHHSRSNHVNHSLSYCEDTLSMSKSINGTKDENSQLTVYAIFMTKSDAEKAIKELNGYKIQGVPIKAYWSVNEGPRRLQLFNFDRDKTKHEVFEHYSFKSPGLVDIIYKPANDLCLLEYESHSLAETALEKLNEEQSKSSDDSSNVGEENTIIVDWARAGSGSSNLNAFNSTFAYYEAKPHEIKALHVRNLTEHIGEDELKELFERYGKLERVKKVRTFAFVHYTEPLNALQAMRELNNKHVANTRLQITVAKKPFNVVLSSTSSPATTITLNSSSLNTGNCTTDTSLSQTFQEKSSGLLQRGYSFSGCPVGSDLSGVRSAELTQHLQHSYARQYSDMLNLRTGSRTNENAIALSMELKGGPAATVTTSANLASSVSCNQRYFGNAAHCLPTHNNADPNHNNRMWETKDFASPKQYLRSTTIEKHYQNHQLPLSHNDLTSNTGINNGYTHPLASVLGNSTISPSPSSFTTNTNFNQRNKYAEKNSQTFKVSKLQPIVDSVKEPLMGLKYITEFHSYINGVLTTSYDCSICEFGVISSIPHHKIVHHIRSNNHIRSYIIKDHSEIWNALVEMAGKASAGKDGEVRDNSAPASMATFFPMITETLEAQYGRQKINVKYDPIYQPRSYSSAVLDGSDCHQSHTNVGNGFGQMNPDHNLYCEIANTCIIPTESTLCQNNSSLYDQPFCSSNNYKTMLSHEGVATSTVNEENSKGPSSHFEPPDQQVVMNELSGALQDIIHNKHNIKANNIPHQHHHNDRGKPLSPNDTNSIKMVDTPKSPKYPLLQHYQTINMGSHGLAQPQYGSPHTLSLNDALDQQLSHMRVTQDFTFVPTSLNSVNTSQPAQWAWNGENTLCGLGLLSSLGAGIAQCNKSVLAGVEHSNPFTLPTFDLKLLGGPVVTSGAPDTTIPNPPRNQYRIPLSAQGDNHHIETNPKASSYRPGGNLTT